MLSDKERNNLAARIRGSVDNLNEQLDEIYELYKIAQNTGIELEVENGQSEVVNFKSDGVKPYRMKVISIKQRIAL